MVVESFEALQKIVKFVRQRERKSRRKRERHYTNKNIKR